MRCNLRKLRVEKGYSQEKLSKALGKSRSTVSGYELGTITPPYPIVLKLKAILDYSNDDLLDIKSH